MSAVIHVMVILHSILREKLPREARGRATLELDEGACVGDVMHRLGLPDNALWAVNGEIEHSRERPLQEGDTLRFFRPGAGG